MGTEGSGNQAGHYTNCLKCELIILHGVLFGRRIGGRGGSTNNQTTIPFRFTTSTSLFCHLGAFENIRPLLVIVVILQLAIFTTINGMSHIETFINHIESGGIHAKSCPWF